MKHQWKYEPEKRFDGFVIHDSWKCLNCWETTISPSKEYYDCLGKENQEKFLKKAAWLAELLMPDSKEEDPSTPHKQT